MIYKLDNKYMSNHILSQPILVEYLPRDNVSENDYEFNSYNSIENNANPFLDLNFTLKNMITIHCSIIDEKYCDKDSELPQQKIATSYSLYDYNKLYRDKNIFNENINTNNYKYKFKIINNNTSTVHLMLSNNISDIVEYILDIIGSNGCSLKLFNGDSDKNVGYDINTISDISILMPKKFNFHITYF